MTATRDPQRLFTDRPDAYTRFIRFMRYPQGLRAFFLASARLRSDLRVLDAGCGTGVVTLALRDAIVRRGFDVGALHGFDLTPAMLDRFREALQRRGLDGVELKQADVLHLEVLPDAWANFDLVVSASMLEYVPRNRFIDALSGLRERLESDGSLVLFITRRNPFTRLVIGRWWQSNLYSAEELVAAFRGAGFSNFRFRKFPLSARHLAVWGYIIEARR